MPSLELDRREALKVLTLAAAGAASACAPPSEPATAYISEPETIADGRMQRFATALRLSGYGRGVVARVKDARPIKLEGNALDRASLGGTDVFTEAAILDLYDPQRPQAPQRGLLPTPWSVIEALLTQRLQQEAQNGGAGLALLTGRITSPTSLRLIGAVQQRFPAMHWRRFEPLHDDTAQAGALQAFGRRLDLSADLSRARVLVCLGADPLGPGPDQARLAHGFAAARLAATPSRIYVAEPNLSQTGVVADYRLSVAPWGIDALACEVARRLGAPLPLLELSAEMRAFVAQTLRDLQTAQGEALVLAGPAQSALTHARCAWINATLSAPVQWLAPVDPHPDAHMASLSGLASDLDRGAVSTLIVLGPNPLYAAPGGLDFGRLVRRAGLVLHASALKNETSAAAHVFAPLSHSLESWSDQRNCLGQTILGQPLVRPFFDTRSEDDLLAYLAGAPPETPRQRLEDTWRTHLDQDGFRAALARGVVDDEAQAVAVAAPRLPPFSPPRQARVLELVVTPSPLLWDGTHASNAWLQECPHPVTKEVWGASVRANAEDAQRLSAVDGDELAITREGRTIAAPLRIDDHQAPGVLCLDAGYGHSRAGPIADGLGANAFALLGRDGAARVAVEHVQKTGRRKPVVSTQRQFALDGELRALFPLARPNASAPAASVKPSLAPPPPPGERAWAMVIDNAACIGCNACVLACQAENNLAVIGPEEMARERDMHWLRIDRYENEGASPGGFQPTPCMHCEEAPCEPVCPVEASVHDSEGLNLQVYNRCIGTRFCQTNCPYKVRRFNYDDYTHPNRYGGLDIHSLSAQRNPDVTVRNRGVMEKCTYCVQRISAARRQADIDDRPIADGEVVTACQAACPTLAIHFGDKNDAESDVANLQSHARRHVLLEDVGTRPRTTYLARLWNPADEESE